MSDSDANPGRRLFHIHSHSDKHTRKEDLTLDQRLNIRADELATNALTESVDNNSFIKTSFSTEKVTISIAGGRISGSPKGAITQTGAD
jgi:hypothetical protein